MAVGTVTVNTVNASTGANITPALATSTTNNKRAPERLDPAPESGPIRVTVSGGSYGR
jgi:hypothetical protein